MGPITVHSSRFSIPMLGSGWVLGPRVAEKMAEYDLTSQIGGYLDRHLVFPMLEFLSEKRVRSVW